MAVETSMMPLLLLGAHLVGDFILQTDHMAANKLTNWRVRAFHVTTYSVSFALILLISQLTWANYGWLMVLIWVTHFITDSRRWAASEIWPPKSIMVDQSIHVITLALLGLAFRL